MEKFYYCKGYLMDEEISENNPTMISGFVDNINKNNTVGYNNPDGEARIDGYLIEFGACFSYDDSDDGNYIWACEQSDLAMKSAYKKAIELYLQEKKKEQDNILNKLKKNISLISHYEKKLQEMK